MSESSESELQIDVLMENGLIREKIYSYLSLGELLQASLVCQPWRRLTRKYIYDHRTCDVKISASQPCKELRRLNECLRFYLQRNDSASLIPINSLTMDFGNKTHRDQCLERTGCRPMEICDAILQVVKLKQLSLGACRIWQCRIPCPAKQVAWSLLQQNASTLETVDLGRVKDPEEQSSMRPSVVLGPRPVFPKLMVIKGTWPSDDYEPIITALVDASPNLRSLYSTIYSNMVGSFPRTKLHTIRLIELDPDATSVSNIQDIAPHLQQLEYICINGPREGLLGMMANLSVQRNVDEYWNTVKLLLVQNRLSLRDIWFGPKAEKKLVSFNLEVPFQQVQHVLFFWNSQTEPYPFTDDGLDIAINELFPNLTHVTVNSQDDEPAWRRSTFEEMLDFLATDHTRRPHLHVKKLTTESFHNQTLYVFGGIFPNIQSLDLTMYSTSWRPLWEIWPGLEEINLYAIAPQVPVPYGSETVMDALFCGIFGPEVEELRGKSNTFLKKVNIVPVMPSITHLRGLKKLNIEVAGPVSPRPALTSRVTELIALRRMPQLSVKTTWKFGINVPGFF